MTINDRLRAWRISICAATGAVSLLTNSAILAADLGLKRRRHSRACALRLDRPLYRRPHRLRLGQFELDREHDRRGCVCKRHARFRSADQLVQRVGQLPQRRASRLQFYAGEPFRHRRRGRFLRPELSERRRPQRRRRNDACIASGRFSDLQRDRARFRHDPGPHWLCAGDVAGHSSLRDGGLPGPTISSR